MNIIISPAKKMKIDSDTLPVGGQPEFLRETEYLKHVMQSFTYSEAKAVWKCNDNIAELNYERFRTMNLVGNLTPAILAYEGIQYQYMAPGVLDRDALDYLEEHLRILSGFYGALRPFDGVVPYRLEMQAKLPVEPYDLYDFWGEKIAEAVCRGADVILNLASKEYSLSVSRHLPEGVRWVDVIFGEWVDGKIKEKGTYAKMARGEMVRFLAENRVERAEDMKAFDRLGYRFAEAYSQPDRMVFLKEATGSHSNEI